MTTDHWRPLRILVLVLLFAAAGCDAGGPSTEDGADAITDLQADLMTDPGPDTLEPPDDVPEPSDTADATDAQPGDPGTDPIADPGSNPDITQDAEPDVPVGPPHRISSSFDARGSVGQVHVRTAVPQTVLQVVDADGNVVREAPVDEWGSLIFRDIDPGRGYSVRPSDDPDDYTGPLTVMSIDGSLPPESFYADQVLEPGFGYLKVRDGTLLSYFLTLPGPPEEGPYPTVVSYSGYSPSRPGRMVSPDVEVFCEAYPTLCNAPDDPSNMIAALLGFATIGVNIRGTGCSDGGYDYFEPLQTLDGYDVIEIVSRQPWVKHHQVGMVGISFPGISQLFVAAARPPGLAAIAPQSVIADSATSCLMPGGIYNDGFAKEWHDMVLYRARPYDPGWVRDVIASGDTLCDAHQKMHGQQRDAIEEALVHPYYTDDVAVPVDPSAWVDRIQVPVFMTGQWHDEQTGPHFAALMHRFTGSPMARFTVTNGFHNDSASPQALVEWIEFLYLFVAREPPRVSDGIKGLASFFMQQIFGAPIPFPSSDLEKADTLDEALALWNARPQVQAIFASGDTKGGAKPIPQGAFAQRFASWPVPGTIADRWYLGPEGTLGATPPSGDGDASAFTHDPDAGHRTTLSSGDVYRLPPNWNWRVPAAGKAVAFISAPLDQTRVMLGHGSADLWIRADATDADLEVTISEVDADGKETLVQSGWLRASHRALRHDATELRPTHSHRFEDIAPLVPGEWVQVRVEIMPFGHVFHAGSRIRVMIDTPGDSTTRWRFRLLEHLTPPTIEIGHDAAHSSSIALPWVPTVQVPTTNPPACGSLRGQPCRDYVAASNGG